MEAGRLPATSSEVALTDNPCASMTARTWFTPSLGSRGSSRTRYSTASVGATRPLRISASWAASIFASTGHDSWSCSAHTSKASERTVRRGWIPSLTSAAHCSEVQTPSFKTSIRSTPRSPRSSDGRRGVNPDAAGKSNNNTIQTVPRMPYPRRHVSLICFPPPRQRV